MKAKLIKLELNEGYRLDDEKGNLIASTSDGAKTKLSHTNCDDIFGVIDVEKLACEEIRIHIDTYQDIHAKSTEKNSSPCTPLNEGGCVGANLYSQVNGFIKGFNKRAELNKDKMFTEEQMREAIKQTRHGMLFLKKYEDEFIQSLQQPQEIEVEIEMEDVKYFRMAQRPKLDSNGCLILKKI
jgi:hypothetical protein